MPCPCMHDVYGRPSYIIDSTKYLSSITVLYVLLLYQDRSPQRVRVAYMYLLGFHAKKGVSHTFTRLDERRTPCPPERDRRRGR